MLDKAGSGTVLGFDRGEGSPRPLLGQVGELDPAAAELFGPVRDVVPDRLDSAPKPLYRSG